MLRVWRSKRQQHLLGKSSELCRGLILVAVTFPAFHDLNSPPSWCRHVQQGVTTCSRSAAAFGNERRERGGEREKSGERMQRRNVTASPAQSGDALGAQSGDALGAQCLRGVAPKGSDDIPQRRDPVTRALHTDRCAHDGIESVTSGVCVQCANPLDRWGCFLGPRSHGREAAGALGTGPAGAHGERWGPRRSVSRRWEAAVEPLGAHAWPSEARHGGHGDHEGRFFLTARRVQGPIGIGEERALSSDARPMLPALEADGFPSKHPPPPSPAPPPTSRGRNEI
ncbi:unnamed protein product [Lampetra planeri]